jgi:histidinol dehydrogenase
MMTMMMVVICTASAADFDATLKNLLAFESQQDDFIDQTAAKILAEVKQEGDAAVLRYTAAFDRVTVPHMQALEIDPKDWVLALNSLPSAQRQALEAAAQRVKLYHERQKSTSWSYTEADGTVLGQQITPLDRVGLYVPGGKAAYPSSVLMNAIPAKVAGVSEVIMVSPTPDGVRNPIVLAAAAIAGVDRIFAIGGVQAARSAVGAACKTLLLPSCVRS